jgi:hypothetical protein
MKGKSHLEATGTLLEQLKAGHWPCFIFFGSAVGPRAASVERGPLKA